ncbi:MAG: hypothetical protein AB1540_13225 [Bdellovibrionota bacterium]
MRIFNDFHYDFNALPSPVRWVFGILILFTLFTPVYAKEKSGKQDSGITAPLSLEVIQEFAAQQGIHKRNDLIKAFPKGLRGSFLLMERSEGRNSECINSTYLRAITFMEYANGDKVIISFNDNPMPGCQDIEITTHSKLKYDGRGNPSGGVTKPGLIQVSPKGKILAYVNEPNKDGRVTEGKCQNCHTSDWLGRWGDYPGWPGSLVFDDEALSHEDSQKLEEKLIKVKSSDGAYALLDWTRTSENPLFPYSGKGRGSDIKDRPNLRLLRFLAKMAFDRAERRLLQLPEDEQIRLFASMACGPLRYEDSFPPDPHLKQLHEDLQLNPKDKMTDWTGAGWMTTLFAGKLLAQNPKFQKQFASVRAMVGNAGLNEDELDEFRRYRFQDDPRLCTEINRLISPVPVTSNSVAEQNLDANLLMESLCTGTCHEGERAKILGSPKLSELLVNREMPQDGPLLSPEEVKSILNLVPTKFQGVEVR